MRKSKKTGTYKILKSAVLLAVSFAGGFIFSLSDISGISSFADISLCSALNLPCAAAVLVGAVIRGVLTDSIGKSIVKIFAMSIAVIAKMFTERCSRPKGSGITALGAVFVSGTAVSLLIGEFPEKIIFYLVYGAIAGFTSYSLCSLIRDFRKRKVINLDGLSGFRYIVVYIIYISSLCSVGVGGFNVGFTVSVAVTLTASYYYYSIGGIICGAVSACGSSFVSPELGLLMAFLPVAGLFTGLIKERKNFASASVFVIVMISLMILTGREISSGDMLGIFCGSSLFVLLSPYYSDRWVSVGQGKGSDSPDINSIRMNFLSDAIEAVRLDSMKISAVLSSKGYEMPTVADPRIKVCSSCYRRTLCASYSCETAGEMIPVLTEDCIHKKEIAGELENNMRSRAAEQLMRLRFSDERELLDEQMKITGEIVRLAGERADVRFSDEKSRQISANLTSHGMNPRSVAAYYNGANRLIIEIYFDVKDVPENRTRICDLISDGLEMNLSSSAPVSSAKEVRICLYEKPPFETEIYSSAICAEKSKISGDSSSFFTDNTGVSYVMISDGMGSGKNAAIDSHLVTGMFRRLICGGMDYSSAIRLINSIMVTKSREESFATLDAVRIDLDECFMTSIKSGAAATIIRSGGDVVKISSPTFPIGITKQAELFTYGQKLSENDMIIMFSDGISEGAYMFIRELLLTDKGTKEIVSEITSKAEIFNQSAHSDDVTVIGIKIKRSGN